MNFPLEPAKTAILPESIDKAVPIDRGGFQTDHHITELHGAKRRHDSSDNILAPPRLFCTEKLECLLPSGFIR